MLPALVLLPEPAELRVALEAERVTVEGARETPEERRVVLVPTTEERVEAPLRAEAPLLTPVDLVRDTLLREAEALRAKLL